VNGETFEHALGKPFGGQRRDGTHVHHDAARAPLTTPGDTPLRVCTV
jgi:hypothetical protein